MEDWNECENCRFRVRYGSEDCQAQLGDWCPARRSFFEPTDDEWEMMDERERKWWIAKFHQLGLDRM